MEYYIMAVLGILIIVWLVKRRKVVNRNLIAIVGQRNAGKTQLILSLGEGKKMQTSPSVKNNTLHKRINKLQYKIVDYYGDSISKEQILSQMDGVHTIVHVVDGTDNSKLGAAALFLYRVLANKKYQRRNCNYILFFNKSDSPAFSSHSKLLHRLQDEIETIKGSRRNSAEENDAEEDNLKSNGNRFSLPTSIRLICGSGQHHHIELMSIIESYC